MTSQILNRSFNTYSIEKSPTNCFEGPLDLGLNSEPMRNAVKYAEELYREAGLLGIATFGFLSEPLNDERQLVDLLALRDRENYEQVKPQCCVLNIL